jgi:hypothetical protein
MTPYKYMVLRSNVELQGVDWQNVQKLVKMSNSSDPPDSPLVRLSQVT